MREEGVPRMWHCRIGAALVDIKVVHGYRHLEYCTASGSKANSKAA